MTDDASGKVRNPFIGELMGRGLHPELANCRRVRFDIPSQKGKPRFRLIYPTNPPMAPSRVPLADRRAPGWPTGTPQGTATPAVGLIPVAVDGSLLGASQTVPS
jgi:hypothetical protein